MKFYCLVTSLLVATAAHGVKIQWGPPVEVASSDSYAGNPQLAIDEQGNGVGVFTLAELDNYATYASTYNGKKGKWTAPEQITKGKRATSPQVASNDSGFTVSVSANNGRIEASTTSLDSKNKNVWTKAVKISPAGEIGTLPQVGVDSGGNALAVWVSAFGGNTFIESAAYSSSTGLWSTPAPISVTNLQADTPQIAVNANGDAVAVWRIKQLGFYLIQAAVYQKSTGIWLTAVNISTTLQNAFAPQIAIDGSGNAIAVWRRSNGSNLVIQSANYNPLTQLWNLPVNLSDPNIDSDSPQIVINGSLEALALWIARINFNYVIQGSVSNTHTPGVWSAPQDFSDLGTNGINPAVTASTGDNAVVLYQLDQGVQKNDLIDSIIYNFPRQLLSSPQKLTNLKSNSSTPKVKMNSSGNVLAIWRATQGDVSKIIARAGQLSPVTNKPLPPTDLKGKQKKVRCFPKPKYANIIKWKPSPTKGVDSYNVYKNGTFVANVPACGPLIYIDENVKKCCQVVYTVTSLKGKKEGPGAFVTVPDFSSSSSSSSCSCSSSS